MRCAFLRRIPGVLTTLIAALLAFGTTLELSAQAAPAQATTAAATTADSAAQALSGAAVIFGSDTLFLLHGQLGAFTAQSRATAIVERLRRLAPAVAQGDSVMVTDHESVSEISIGEEVVMSVLEADAAPSGIPRSVLAARFSEAIRATLLASAKSKTVQALLIDTGLALLATGALVLVLWLLALAFPRLYAKLDGLSRERLPSIRL